MLLFEKSLILRREAARKNAKAKTNKRDVSAEDRFRQARDLIGKNYSTNEISKILQISERSVTRFKKRMREEKRKLKEAGKLHGDPNDIDNSFRYLSDAEKLNRVAKLFNKDLKYAEIAQICKVSERTVRRWKERLEQNPPVLSRVIDQELDMSSQSEEESVAQEKKKLKRVEPEEEIKPKRQRKPYYDYEKVQYATELMQNGLSNKEMSMLLELSIANVRKLKVNILNGTVDDLIDDSLDHYTKVKDPLNDIDGSSIPVLTGMRRKPKLNLTEREMHVVRILRDKEFRTMDIAKMVGISERSVTRLLTKSREVEVYEYGLDVLEEVERLLSIKDQLISGEIINTRDAMEVSYTEIEEIQDAADHIQAKLETDAPEEELTHDENYSYENPSDDIKEYQEIIPPPSPEEIEPPPPQESPKASKFEQNYISKSRIGMNLIEMNVETADIMKMLEVNEKQVQQWRKMVAAKKSVENHPELKEEPSSRNKFVIETEAAEMDIANEEFV